MFMTLIQPSSETISKSVSNGRVERIKRELCRRDSIHPYMRGGPEGECKGGVTIADGHDVVLVLVDAVGQARHVRRYTCLSGP
jgi:hypothetical protein